MRIYEPPKQGDLKEVKIELTRNCLLSCMHCSSSAFSGNNIQLPREIVLSLVKQSAELGAKSIVFSGGEPLLWPWLADAVNTCSIHGLRCSIYSTGINSTEDGTQEILGLAKHGLNKVVFSLYSPVKEVHEEITRSIDSFNKTVAVIRAIANSQIEKEIHFVPLKRNYMQLGRLVQLAKDAEIRKISVLRFVPQGRGVLLKQSHEMLAHKETMELRALVVDCRKQNGVEIRLGSPYNILMLDKETDCVAAHGTLCIGPSGNIYPCDAFKTIEPREIGVTDAYNNVMLNSLRDCWEKSEYLNAIRRYLTTPFGKPCSQCLNLDLCKSGCLAQKVLEQESIEDGNIAKRPDPLCLRSMIGG